MEMRNYFKRNKNKKKKELILNKNQANAVQVAIDNFIDTLYEFRKPFDDVEYNRREKVEMSTLIGFGLYILKIIRDQLEGDIEGMKETIEDNWDDKEEKEHWEEILKSQEGALELINKAIEYNKKGVK